MTYKCCVSSCKIASDSPAAINKKISFHSLPKKAKQKWQSILEPHCPTIYTRKIVHVCSRHFKEDSFHYPGLGKAKCLKNGCEPTIFENYIASNTSPEVNNVVEVPMIAVPHQENTSPEVNNIVEVSTIAVPQQENTSPEVNNIVEVSTIAVPQQENAPQASLKIPSSTFTFSAPQQVLPDTSAEVNNLVASLNIPPELQNVPVSPDARDMFIQLQGRLDQYEGTVKSLGSVVQEQAKRMEVLEEKLVVSDYNCEQLSHQITELKEKLFMEREKNKNLKRNLGRCREKLVEWNRLKRKLVREKMLDEEDSITVQVCGGKDM